MNEPKLEVTDTPKRDLFQACAMSFANHVTALWNRSDHVSTVPAASQPRPQTHELNSRTRLAKSRAARSTLWSKNKKTQPDDQLGASVRPTHHNTHLRHHGGPLWQKKSGTAFSTPKTRSGGSFLLFESPRNRVREPQSSVWECE